MPPQLRSTVAGIALIEQYDPAYALERLLPNPDTTLLIDLSDRPKQVYDNQTLEPTNQYTDGWVSGVHCCPITMDAGPNDRMLIIRLRAGATLPVLGCAATELRDRVEPLEPIWGHGFRRLRQRLLETADDGALFARACAYLGECTEAATAGHPCVAAAVELLRTAPTGSRIEQIASATGYSRAYVARRFASEVGVGPKMFARLLRLERALQLLAAPVPRLAAVACAAGYYDQAHFGNEFRLLAGMTPRQYLAARSPYVGYTIVPNR